LAIVILGHLQQGGLVGADHALRLEKLSSNPSKFLMSQKRGIVAAILFRQLLRERLVRREGESFRRGRAATATATTGRQDHRSSAGQYVHSGICAET
jgi:hypothetical protein